MYTEAPDPGSADNAAISTTASRSSGRQFATERSARRIVCEADPRYRIPTPAQRRALLVGFAMCGKALAGAAFDAVRLDGAVNLDDVEDIARRNGSIVLIEIKSTGREAIGDDLKGYFFNITSAELLVAQSLGEQYRFLFVNTVRRNFSELAISDVWARATLWRNCAIPGRLLPFADPALPFPVRPNLFPCFRRREIATRSGGFLRIAKLPLRQN